MNVLKQSAQLWPHSDDRRHITRLSQSLCQNKFRCRNCIFHKFLLHLIGGGISSFDLAECVDAPSVCCCRRYFVVFARSVLSRFLSAPTFDAHICCFRLFLLHFLYFLFLFFVSVLPHVTDLETNNYIGAIITSPLVIDHYTLVSLTDSGYSVPIS